VIAAIANSRIKISLHTLFASYCTVILFRIGMICGVAALLLGGLEVVASLSRPAHRRRTLAE
jgi:hypothetical protein